MPARRERIHICPDRDGQPVRILDFPYWWDRGGFFDRFGGRMLDTGNPLYCDSALLLTAGEAAAWDRDCRAGFASDPAATSLGETGRAQVELQMQRIEAALATAAWVIVESCEWESGLD